MIKSIYDPRMQQRVALTKILSFLDEASTHIIEICADLRKEVKERGLIVSELMPVFPKVPKEVIMKEVDDKIASYLALPEVVKKELDAFVAALDAGAAAIESDESGTFEYMREVWLGDVYGVSGLNALKELAKELKRRVDVELQDEELLKTLAASIELKK